VHNIINTYFMCIHNICACLCCNYTQKNARTCTQMHAVYIKIYALQQASYLINMDAGKINLPVRKRVIGFTSNTADETKHIDTGWRS